MNELNHNSRRSTAYRIIELVLSIVGTLIALTVYAADRAHVDLPCTASGGCEIVANSSYAWLGIGALHIPVALLGAAGYFAILSLIMVRMGSDDPRIALWAHFAQTALALFGAGFSWYLQWVAHFVLFAFCPWCFTSACVMTLLCVFTIVDLSQGVGRPRQQELQRGEA